MNELVALVSSKTGISEDKALLAVTAVLGFLKDRLPAPLAGQVENLLAQNGAAATGLGADETGATEEEGGFLKSIGKKIGL